MHLLVCSAKVFGVCPVNGSWANSNSSQFEDGVFLLLLLDDLEGGWPLLFQPDIEGVDGAAKGVKDKVCFGLGGSGGRTILNNSKQFPIRTHFFKTSDVVPTFGRYSTMYFRGQMKRANHFLGCPYWWYRVLGYWWIRLSGLVRLKGHYPSSISGGTDASRASNASTSSLVGGETGYGTSGWTSTSFGPGQMSGFFYNETDDFLGGMFLACHSAAAFQRAS